MQFHLVLLLFFSHHTLILTTIAFSTNKYNYFNKNNSLINIDFYQCNTNITTSNSTTTLLGTIFNDQINSCNFSCCLSNNSNQTIPFDLCQVTVQSLTGICLGRLCYSGECENFALLANITHDSKIKNKTTIMNRIHSSFSYIPWSLSVNSTKTKLSSWINKTGLTIPHTILILLFIINVSLTCMALITVIKSIRHAHIIADQKSYRYTLL